VVEKEREIKKKKGIDFTLFWAVVFAVEPIHHHFYSTQGAKEKKKLGTKKKLKSHSCYLRKKGKKKKRSILRAHRKKKPEGGKAVLKFTSSDATRRKSLFSDKLELSAGKKH